MKKGKITMRITIGIICFVLSLVMFMQFKTVEETDITSIENMKEAELRTELANWKNKYEETKKQLDDTVSKIDEYKKIIENDQEASELLDKDLQQLKLLLGQTDVEGEGVIITLSDNENQDIVADDILELIHELKLAGAEAISVNNERIISSTDILYIDNKYITINAQRVTSPYVIKAIGNQKYLESGLNQKGIGYLDKYSGSGKTIKFEKQNNIKILKYNKEMKLKYIEM